MKRIDCFVSLASQAGILSREETVASVHIVEEPFTRSSAVRAVAAGSFGLSRDSLVAETVRALGYQRKGPRIQTVLEEALDELIRRGVIHMEDGKVHLVEESIDG